MFTTAQHFGGQGSVAPFQAAAEFAKAKAGNQNSYMQGMAGLGQSAAYERANLYGANAMAEAARQGALSNIGSAGLGAYGSNTNAAMDAWSKNQMAYNSALANMHSANASTAAVQSMPYGDMSGAFSAYGQQGPIGSGAYAAAGGSPLGGLTQQFDGNPALDRLDRQHYSSRGMPSEMLGQGLSGLMALTAQNTGSINGGMNQFYGNQTGAANQFAGMLGGLQNDMNAANSGGNSSIDRMWDQSLGKTFLTPAEMALQNAAAKQVQRNAAPMFKSGPTDLGKSWLSSLIPGFA